MATKKHIKEKVLQLHSEGKTVVEITNILNCSSDTVRFHTDLDYKVRKTKYKSIHRNRIKNKLVELKGGKCQICGYNKFNKALQFHHINPENKEFGISEYKTYNIDAIIQEINKCILVCANCHAEIEGGFIDIKDFVPIE